LLLGEGFGNFEVDGLVADLELGGDGEMLGFGALGGEVDLGGE
jgi:hypothetical protein